MRPGAVAIGGYYPTPKHLLPALASLFEVAPNARAVATVIDPCAGEGEAVEAIANSIQGKVQVFAIELEETRARACVERFSNGAFIEHSDAMMVEWSEDGVDAEVLFLNPPYDHDPTFKRLEERFLQRFAPALASGGALLFLVPFYALAASAETLSRWFVDVECRRFPEGDFAVFKQVVVTGRRREVALPEPDPAVVERIRSWSVSVDGLPELVERERPLLRVLRRSERRYSAPWRPRPLDVMGLLAAVKPWHQTDRMGSSSLIVGVGPDPAGALERSYPLATPPRPAHIAAGIAAGIFNGREILPTKGTRLPPLLLKGVFDREFRTVDTKRDRDGDIVGEVQVQQPKLVTTALDLSTFTYRPIAPSTKKSASPSVDALTMADLLEHYGRGMMDVMLERCPVMHDPARATDTFPLPELARPLYDAQAHATMATVKLLGGPNARPRARRRKAAFLLGEVGVGKSSVAISTALAVKARRTLVVCPPHLLRSWCDQVKAVAPWIRTVVIESVTDVDRVAVWPAPEPVIAILSRETAKLGHAIEGVERCPRCGADAGKAAENARTRARCGAMPIIYASYAFARLATNAARAALFAFPESETLAQAMPKPIAERVKKMALHARVKAECSEGEWAARTWAKAAPPIGSLAKRLATFGKVSRRALIETLVAANPDPALVVDLARRLFARTTEQTEWRSTARRLMLLIPSGKVVDDLVLELSAKHPLTAGAYCSEDDQWEAFRGDQKELAARRDHGWRPRSFLEMGGRIERDKANRLLLDGKVVGDPSQVAGTLLTLYLASTRFGPPCGEPLFQAVPKPARFPVATYIAMRHRKLFDFLILDEAHENANAETAQSIAANRLAQLGMPTVLLTGTVNGGYAESMFANMWMVSPAFRAEFARDQKQRFIDRYGYRKQLVEQRDRDTKKPVAFGSMTDRVDRVERPLGNAPGILPLFLLKHLLPYAVTIHKADLAVNVPPCTDEVVRVQPTDEQLARFLALASSLKHAISQDLFTERAGKLWGAMSELPSYLDVCTQDVGNTEVGDFVLAYPEDVGGAVVAQQRGFPRDEVLPKERALLDHLQALRATDRNVLILVWHVRLIKRLQWLIEREMGYVVPTLDPAKVPTAKRETWIDEQVVRKNARAMLANPVTVQTGLNNLVHFSDEWWHENPGVNGVVLRQTVGRIDRIGQKRPTRVIFPVYDGTIQEAAHRLLMHKVAVSQSVDGLDSESAMAAAGVGEQDDFSSFAVGRQLYELLKEEHG